MISWWESVIAILLLGVIVVALAVRTLLRQARPAGVRATSSLGHTDRYLVVLGAFILPVTIFMQWGSAGAVGREANWTLWDIRGINVVVLIAALAAIGSAILEAVIAKRRPVAALAVATLTVTIGIVFIVGAESIDWLIPRSLLPRTIRRLTIGLGAGLGAWIAVAAATLVLLAGTGHGASGGRRVGRWVTSASDEPIQLVGVALLVTATVALAFARYYDWVEITATTGTLDVPGFAVPVVGPFSVLVVFTWAAAIVTSIAGRGSRAALLAVAATSLVLALMLSTTIATAGLVGRTGLIERLTGLAGNRDPLGGGGLDTSVGPALWIAYASCLLAAAGAALAPTIFVSQEVGGT